MKQKIKNFSNKVLLPVNIAFLICVVIWFLTLSDLMVPIIWILFSVQVILGLICGIKKNLSNYTEFLGKAISSGFSAFISMFVAVATLNVFAVFLYLFEAMKCIFYLALAGFPMAGILIFPAFVVWKNNVNSRKIKTTISDENIIETEVVEVKENNNNQDVVV